MVLQATFQAKEYIQKWVDTLDIGKGIIAITLEMRPLIPTRILTKKFGDWLLKS